MLGELVNNYRIIRLIAEGGMGSIYSAEHTLIGKRVAIKVLRPEVAVDPNLVNRFFNEARVISGIKHPNIVEVTDFGSLPNGMPYMVMELLYGETVSARLERERHLPVREALDMTLQAASALAVAHSAHVVHRDLKPENLFIVQDERDPGKELIKVLDFGIAKHRDDEGSTSVKTKFGSFLGTPAYMSPEQCRGVPEGIDHRSDIYALAVCLYEMLCGGPPFTAEGYGDIMVMQITHVPTSPRHIRPDVPERVDAAILKALQKRPEDRFQGMEAFAEALDPARRLLVAVDPPTISPSPSLPPAAARLSPVARLSLATDAAASKQQRHENLADTIELPSPAASLPSPAASLPSPATAVTIELPSPAASATSAAVTEPSLTPAGAEILSADNTVSSSADASPHNLRSGRNKVWLLVAALFGGIIALVGWQSGLFEVNTASLETGEQRPTRSGRVGTVVKAALPADQKYAAQNPTGKLPTAEDPVSDIEGLDRGATDQVRSKVPAAGSVSGESGSEMPGVASAALVGGSQEHAAAQRLATPTRHKAVPSTVAKTRSNSRAIYKSTKPSSRVGSVSREKPGVSRAKPGNAPKPPTSSTTDKEPQAKFGFLRLDSSPWASVTLGSRKLGATPLIDVKLPAGTHVLVLKNTEVDHQMTFAVTIKPGETTRRVVGWGK